MTFFRIIILIINIITYTNGCAQLYPGIQWQNTIGGTDSDNLSKVINVSNYHYIVGGSSLSGISGDKNQDSFGDWDYWVTKLDFNGNVVWQETIGGNQMDALTNLSLTGDSGIVIGGYSWSGISGVKTENSRGATDYWILKLDSNGLIQWQKTIGGNSSDELSIILKSFDNGFVVGGTSESNISGEKTENCKGLNDFWIIKIDSIGTIQWQKTIGGNDFDYLTAMVTCADGGYLAGGYSSSNVSGDKTAACRGGFDYWIVKLDSSGSIEWQKTIGGYFHDKLIGMSSTNDMGFILAGQSWSDISGEKTENSRGAGDYWIIKIDSIGNIQWQKTIGGTEGEFATSIFQTPDSGYFIGGASASSISGEKSENNRGNSLTGDYWVLKTDSIGTIQWQKTIGGADNDELYTVIPTSDNSYLLGGFSNSSIGFEKDENCQGLFDYWIVKLNGITGLEHDIHESEITISPNPTSGIIQVISAHPKFHFYNITIISSTGNMARNIKCQESGNITLDISELIPGIYFLQIETSSGILMRKLVKM